MLRSFVRASASSEKVAGEVARVVVVIIVVVFVVVAHI